jgi:uncharacterized protein with PIN domain
MLGSLAKWLRILGYDTLFDPGLDDHQLVRLARAEGRVLLTRDRELARRRGVRRVLIASERLDEQIRQVWAELDLEPFAQAGGARSETFAHRRGRAPRCPVCNESLQTIDLEAARSRVPPYVAETQQVFCLCPACQRVYWRGTHWQHMQQYLEEIQR